MRFRIFSTVSSFGLIAALTACNGSGMQTQPPNAADSSSIHRPSGNSWMDPAATGQELLYVSDREARGVYIYQVSTNKLVGKLTGFGEPAGMCSDLSGNV